MNARQNTSRMHHHRTTRTIHSTFATFAAAALVVGISALPAAARQDPGQIDPPTQATTAIYFCTLERVGTQFVACDNLTGNGVPAPRWVHER